VTLNSLVDLLRDRRIAVLTGAGCSTESGIPDYRGPETRRRARNPIQYRAFMQDREARRRYWARALVGWQRFRDKSPNPAHTSLAALERAGIVTGIVTQNVDRLHQAAGSLRVIELHGALEEVVCLECGHVHPRKRVQEELEARNPRFACPSAPMAPDGDADVEPVAHFDLVTCPCGGDLKPNVVFFGESVPKERVDAAWWLVRDADVLLVVGSSLAVYSGYRFVRGAARDNQPVAIVNLGPTRGDAQATVRVSMRAGCALPAVAHALLDGPY